MTVFTVPQDIHLPLGYQAIQKHQHNKGNSSAVSRDHDVPLIHLLEIAVIQSECHPANVFREKCTGITIHQEREFGPLGEHL